MKKFVCLLTGSINPLKGLPFTNLTDPDIRRRQYIESINYHLSSYNFPLVFVENTGSNLSYIFKNEIDKGNLEVLTFIGNAFPPMRGKGLGDFECINHAINHSKYISDSTFIFKITGRYQIKNLSKFVKQWNSSENVIALSNTNFSKSYTDTRFIGFSPYFIDKYLSNDISILNDSEGIYFENVVFNSIKTAIKNNEKVDLFKGSPIIIGIAGSMNIPYKSGKIRQALRHIRESLRYYKFHLIKLFDKSHGF